LSINFFDKQKTVAKPTGSATVRGERRLVN
jgi:hypothetical protein